VRFVPAIVGRNIQLHHPAPAQYYIIIANYIKSTIPYQNLRQLMCVLLRQDSATKLCRTIIPEPTERLILNLRVVKDMGLLGMDKHLQLPDAPGSLIE
jgi:hypothetical protein